jgi:hypothetical protein
MVRRIAALPLPTDRAVRQASEPAEGKRDVELYEKSLEMRYFRTFRT